MLQPANTLRVGAPPYLVARPLTAGLERESGIALALDVPARLVAGLRDGSLDVALVSSIELFRRPGYRYLAGPAVTGHGFVGSVQVFLRRPLAEVTSVVLDPASRAAQALTRVVLPRRLRSKDVRWIEAPLEVDPGELAEREDLDAWLRIGDPALRAHLAPGSPPVFNPCAAWSEDFALPFVFAPWIVRPGLELSAPQIEAFAAARARGAERIEALASEASRAWSLPLEACRKYLGEECRYDPGEDLEPALFTFRDQAARLGLCEGDLAPRAIEVPARR